MFYLFVFLFGLIIGSFLNVVLFRYDTKKSLVNDRSKCRSCEKVLKWYELIPVFSFLWQRGKCAGCGKKISWQYPLVELATGALFLLIFNNQFSIFNKFSIIQFSNINPHFLLSIAYWLIITCFLILIFVYDYHTQIIPNEFVYPFIFLSFFSFFVENWALIENWKLKIENFAPHFLTGIFFFLFFWSLWFFSHGRAMGFGDAKLAIGIGWFLGLQDGIIALLLSFWIGAIVGIFLLVLNKKKYNIKSKIAFGPFMVFGTLLAFLFGNNLVGLWLNLFS